MLLIAGSLPATQLWQAECATPPRMPEMDAAISPVPQTGKWRGKGFGDKRKLDVGIEDCGRTITGMAGVKLKHVADRSIPLELDEDDGRYKASFTYSEGGMTAVVTWDLEVESPSRLTGRMTIMGRADRVEYELLEAKPGPELANCECETVRTRHDELAASLAQREQDPDAALGDHAAWGWAVDADSCGVRPGSPDRWLPTQASLEALMLAGWEGALVRRERCCAARRAEASNGVQQAAMQDDRSDDVVAVLLAEITALETWLQERCD